MNKVLVTVTGLQHNGAKNVLKVGDFVTLRAEENEHDIEAVFVEKQKIGLVGFVANSVDTRYKGTHSAGYIVDAVKRNFGTIGKVVVVGKSGMDAIVEVEIAND